MLGPGYPASAREWDDNPLCVCGHPSSHHEAGECWTNDRGQEVCEDPACGCSWYQVATPRD